ncbi:MAG: hypothetical protein B6243_00545 [Anaerolineaceae bacterium 4572_5.2]|nr:MAG: hypothetical protein B6243_00545 [Anaerolineaceae bacterium 4572_5.2]
MPADLIITNAKIYTMDPACPTATAFAVRDGAFLMVGNASEVAETRGAKTEVIDLEGQPVLPGLCDAHIHFTAYALSLSRVNLFEVPSLAELQRRVAEKVKTASPGAWLKGFGWNHTLWPE